MLTIILSILLIACAILFFQWYDKYLTRKRISKQNKLEYQQKIQRRFEQQILDAIKQIPKILTPEKPKRVYDTTPNLRKTWLRIKRGKRITYKKGYSYYSFDANDNMITKYKPINNM